MISKPPIPAGSKVVISIRDLQKSFDGTPVLQGVSLDLHERENLVILGRSGTGKSVLIKIIAGLLAADAGTVSVLGQQVNSLTQKGLAALRVRIGFCFQNSALYDSMTVAENLAFPLRHHCRHLSKKEKEIRIDETLDAVGLLQYKNTYPAALSGGQRKRAGIARTLILQPEIMLYDEPTAGLDPITSDEINTLINKVQQAYKTSAIIITHDLTCAKETGNTLMMLQNGRITAAGSFNDIFNPGNAQAQLFYNYNFVQ